MDNLKMRHLVLTIVASCFAFFLSYAQPVVKTTADKTEILIGQQFKLTIAAKFSGDDFFIKWISIPDSLEHFELIEKSSIDSIFSNQKLTSLSQTFTFTSFDSGKWLLPSFNIYFTGQKNDSTLKFSTDSLPMIVAFSNTDTTQTLKDIKGIREVEAVSLLWYWIAGAVLLILLVIMGIWFYRRSKSSKKTPLPKSGLSPYEEAMENLGKLDAFDLTIPKEVQQYHTSLIEIFRVYLSRKQNINYLNKTTGDILLSINEAYNNKEIETKVSAALRFSNAVKFAKFIPVASDSQENKKSIKESINLMESPALLFKP